MNQSFYCRLQLMYFTGMTLHILKLSSCVCPQKFNLESKPVKLSQEGIHINLCKDILIIRFPVSWRCNHSNIWFEI